MAVYRPPRGRTYVPVTDPCEAGTRRLQKVKGILVVNLHFHHVDPSTKSFALSVATALSKLREEAKKCVLVCANRHGEIETRLIPSRPVGATHKPPTIQPQH
jgi:hypothetical protein